MKFDVPWVKFIPPAYTLTEARILTHTEIQICEMTHDYADPLVFGFDGRWFHEIKRIDDGHSIIQERCQPQDGPKFEIRYRYEDDAVTVIPLN